MADDRFEWFYMGASGQVGPLNEAQILDLASHASIKPDTLVWKVGMESWTPAGSVPILASRIQPTWTPPPLATPPAPPRGSSPVSGTAVCPRDGSQLRRENRSGVEIDWCPSCRGVWLDRGELERLISRDRDYDDDDDDRRGGRRGFLGNVFDIFD